MTEDQKQRLSIRSVTDETVQKLRVLRHVTRLSNGSLIDDAIEDLWAAYEADGHSLDAYLPQ
ncbi:hypothetical protein EBB79_03970 [Parasedimentitalea marina]|uniref:Uncharacterized protein n=1 Tax=Parasedimentitalea marina TaxID=2483033 RepID=A0A3T0MZE0_9RHOB|nr:hypothetical protein [Parasedimentitalea marina]AZV77130.1 hypothetical protein EBB79_03970 [Parasedimentitalea marina]PCJ08525.1 MAG: hypothetical protein COB16_07565 [Paracoccaceae bacterium]